MIFSASAMAQEKQDERFKVKSVEVTLDNGEKLWFSGRDFGGLRCGKATAGLTVLWLVDKDRNGLQFYEHASQDYLFRKQLASDKRIKRNLDSIHAEKESNSLLEVEERLLNIETMLAQLLIPGEFSKMNNLSPQPSFPAGNSHGLSPIPARSSNGLAPVGSKNSAESPRR